MTEEEAREVRAVTQEAYRQGVVEARAAFSSELRLLADFTEQVFQLRQEMRRALKLPPLAGPGRGTLQ